MAPAAPQPTQVATGFPLGAPPPAPPPTGAELPGAGAQGCANGCYHVDTPPRLSLLSRMLHHRQTQTGNDDSCLLHAAS